MFHLDHIYAYFLYIQIRELHIYIIFNSKDLDQIIINFIWWLKSIQIKGYLSWTINERKSIWQHKRISNL